MQRGLLKPYTMSFFRIDAFDFYCCVCYNCTMMLQEFNTEEPIYPDGVDFPCCTGDHMDWRDNDETTFDVYDNTVEGYHWYPLERAVLIQKDRPLCDIDGLVRDILARRIDRIDAAYKADWHLDRLLHIRLAIDLTMGEFLTCMKKQGVSALGYRSIGTFSVEHLSFSGRLASEMMHNFEVLLTLPLTKEAYLQGEIMKSALRYASRVMNPENEADWISKAQSISLNDLKREVKHALLGNAEAGKGAATDTSNDEDSGDPSSTTDITHCEPDFPSEESGEQRKGVMMDFRVSHKLALIWDFALQHFRDKEHYSGVVSAFVEALLANFITSGNRAPASLFLTETMYGDRLLFSEKVESVPTDTSAIPVFYRCHMKPEEDERISRIRDSEPPKRIGAASSEEGSSRALWRIFFPPSFYKAPDNVREAAKILIECALMRQYIDVAMGKLLWAMREWGLHRILKCGSIEEYGIKCCDLSKPLLYRLMKLADGMERHPLIREAFESGYITKEQARLILRIVNKKNEKAWIDYAAHVPTVNLQEEVERCRRIIEYDCLAAGFYAILPGFRYITDDRFHELPEDIRDIIRTGAWYQGPSMLSSWPLEEDDEQCVTERDRRLEEPWNYFGDVDELLIYQAETKEAGRRLRSNGGAAQRTSNQGVAPALCAAAEAGQGTSGQGAASTLCAPEVSQRSSGQGAASALCAPEACLSDTSPHAAANVNETRMDKPSARNTATSSTSTLCAAAKPSGEGFRPQNTAPSGNAHSNAHSSAHSNAHSNAHSTPHYNAEDLSKAREICTLPHGADPAETFLMDILADDSGPVYGNSLMSIRFFLPEELYELWNLTFRTWLMQATAEEVMSAQSTTEKYITEYSRHRIGYTESFSGCAEGFLAALLQDWLLTERLHFKVTENYAILKRDHFQCQSPGCKCRRNLQAHHIKWRSKGGGDEESNRIILCKACHKHILHDLMALKIEGNAPYNLTFTFGPHSGDGDSDGPFLVYHNGRKKMDIRTGSSSLVAPQDS